MGSAENQVELIGGDNHRAAEPMASPEFVGALAQRALGNLDPARGERSDPFGGGAGGVQERSERRSGHASVRFSAWRTAHPKAVRPRVP